MNGKTVPFRVHAKRLGKRDALGLLRHTVLFMYAFENYSVRKMIGD